MRLRVSHPTLKTKVVRQHKPNTNISTAETDEHLFIYLFIYSFIFFFSKISSKQEGWKGYRWNKKKRKQQQQQAIIKLRETN